MKRSTWKLPFINSVFFKKRFISKNFNNLYLRNSTVPFNCINKTLRVYNGIWYSGINILRNTVGHKFGEFSFTKRCDAQIQSRRKTKKKTKKKN